MLESFKRPPFNQEDAKSIAADLVNIFNKRRTIRKYAKETPCRSIIENSIKIASSAPSGANRQPWHFAVIENQNLKNQIRILCEKEEHDFYHVKPNKEWVNDLKHLYTNEEKAFLTEAPYLIAIFYSHYHLDQKGEKRTHYYAKESVGLATGMLLSALHLSGLNTLTYTPKRMQFLSKLLERPCTERPFMVVAVGLAHEDSQVPKITKKTIEEVSNFYN